MLRTLVSPEDSLLLSGDLADSTLSGSAPPQRSTPFVREYKLLTPNTSTLTASGEATWEIPPFADAIGRTELIIRMNAAATGSTLANRFCAGAGLAAWTQIEISYAGQAIQTIVPQQIYHFIMTKLSSERQAHALDKLGFWDVSRRNAEAGNTGASAYDYFIPLYPIFYYLQSQPFYLVAAHSRLTFKVTFAAANRVVQTDGTSAMTINAVRLRLETFHVTEGERAAYLGQVSREGGLVYSYSDFSRHAEHSLTNGTDTYTINLTNFHSAAEEIFLWIRYADQTNDGGDSASASTQHLGAGTVYFPDPYAWDLQPYAGEAPCFLQCSHTLGSGIRITDDAGTVFEEMSHNELREHMYESYPAAPPAPHGFYALSPKRFPSIPNKRSGHVSFGELSNPALRIVLRASLAADAHAEIYMSRPQYAHFERGDLNRVIR